MASGLLTGAGDQARVDGLSETDWRASSPAFREPLLSQTLSLVDRLRPIGERLDVPLPHLVVAWVVAQPGVTGAIVGARTPRHVEGWVGAADLELDDTVLAEIDTAIEASGAGSDAPPAPPAHIRAVDA
jgi:aryl-alcohol dehydrogenase-like predicted oxidoreductase